MGLAKTRARPERHAETGPREPAAERAGEDAGGPAPEARRRPVWLALDEPVLQGFLTGLTLLVTGLTACWLCYATAFAAYRHTLDEDLLACARVAALHIDGDAHARLTQPQEQNGPAYLAMVEPLRRVADAGHHLRYIYTLRPTPGGLAFILDTGQPWDTDGDGQIDQASLGQVYDEGDPQLLEVARTGQAGVTTGLYSDRWGSFFSAYVPIRRADGGLECVLGVDQDAADYLSRLASMRRSLAIGDGLCLAASLAMGVGVTLHGRARRRDVRRLAESEQRYALATRASQDGLWDWNLNDGTAYFSEHFAELLGEPAPPAPDDAQDWFHARLHPDDLARSVAKLQAHLRGEGPFDLEYRLRRRSGGYRWFHVRGHAYRDAHGQPVRMVGSINDVHDRVRLRRRLRRAARIDRLTGLSNRAAIVARLNRLARERAAAPDLPYALLYLDFDRFKQVNDTLGHEAGDALLVAIATRLRAALRAGGHAARLGGDEFVVLLDDITDGAAAAAVASRLIAALSRPYAVAGQIIISTASIGIVLGTPSYCRADDLLRDADAAMYAAKAAGGGRFVVFNDRTPRHPGPRPELGSPAPDGPAALPAPWTAAPAHPPG
jgi:diguanylate cyclase (GGDEF)-like protein/PAS domain S-box-containing protein